jgi:hypothetical protein
MHWPWSKKPSDTDSSAPAASPAPPASSN